MLKSLIKVSPLILALIFMVGACKAGKKSGKSAKKTQTENLDSSLSVSNEVAGYEKTPCYGRCPVFKVRFYADGKVTWHGRMNVERMGMYEAKVDSKVILQIKAKAESTGYYQMKEEYPHDYKIADLPFTITFVRFGDKTKAVRNMMDAPEKLLEFEKYLEELIAKLEWKKMQE